MKERKWGKHIQDTERLPEKLQKCPCFYEKGNEVYKEKDQGGGGMLGEQLSSF